MSENILKAMQRVRSVFARRPQLAIHADEPATARWNEGLRVVTFDANGTQITTDMPAELGGAGNQVTPGWLLRAALASCLATRIAMEAAASGIVLGRLEVLAKSTSDIRGLLGMTDDAGTKIAPGPQAVELEVKIGAINATEEQVRALIDDCVDCSPVSAAIGGSVPIALHVDIEPN